MTPATAEPTLKELADLEADAAEAEAAAQDPGIDPFPSSRPGENGAATQAEAPAEVYEPPEPSQQEIDLAGDKYLQLQNDAREMGEQSVIDSLIAIVDLHPMLRTPEIFGSNEKDREVYHPADNIAEIARFLCRACPRLDVQFNRVVFYYRDHEKWLRHGQRVPGAVKDFDGFQQHHNDGTRHAIIVNYHYFKVMNPRQKIFHVYRLLRSRDRDGAKRAYDFHGFFEEPGLFGAGVHEEMVTMAKAFVRDAPAHADDPYQLSILSGIYDEEA